MKVVYGILNVENLLNKAAADIPMKVIHSARLVNKAIRYRQ